MGLQEREEQQQYSSSSSVPDKVILVLIDGVGDVSIPAFGDRTPLQVAHTPNLDCIAGALYCCAVMCWAQQLVSCYSMLYCCLCRLISEMPWQHVMKATRCISFATKAVEVSPQSANAWRSCADLLLLPVGLQLLV
eukprot:GHRQ01031551.1.p2 GENE.GHRQ01031551.1~~GHRQ01031551.1.p2  ORF type:complete len:136 (+),score=41.47 GHRQ01031551.1:192-599(+)